ncbi:MAG TPA: hypothetical protein VLJ19_13825 [Variovorax sp.]|nr:hypothetical protein [Variovorax sp.]
MFAALRSRTTMPRRYAWLLWFALLLPLAQAAASSHVYSHTGELAAGVEGLTKSKHAAGAAHCDLCLASSIALGGGLPTATLPTLPLRSNHPAPQAAFDSLWEPAPTLAYQGRAPPFALT